MSVISFFKDFFYDTIYKRLKEKSPIILYPFEKYQASNRSKGLIALTIKENAELSCNSCGLCIDVCPSDCITIETTKELQENFQPPKQFKVDILKCVYCGFCEEICPVDAIRLTSEMPPIIQNKQDALWEIEKLAFRNSLNHGKGIRGLIS